MINVWKYLMTFYLSTLGFKCLIMFLFCDEMYHKNNMKKNAYVSILQILKKCMVSQHYLWGSRIQGFNQMQNKNTWGKKFPKFQSAN